MFDREEAFINLLFSQLSDNQFFEIAGLVYQYTQYDLNENLFPALQFRTDFLHLLDGLHIENPDLRIFEFYDIVYLSTFDWLFIFSVLEYQLLQAKE